MSIATKKKIVDVPEPIILHVPTAKEVVQADDVKIPAGILAEREAQEIEDQALAHKQPICDNPFVEEEQCMSTILERPIGRHSEMVVIDVPVENNIVVAEDVVVPAGIVDLAGFREWAFSGDFPERGRIDYRRGTIISDLTMEQAYSHNGVKTPFIGTVARVLQTDDRGQLFGDRMRISLPTCDASCEPDGMFILYESLRSGKVVRKPGRRGGVLEFVGVPDLLLEVVSDSSEDLDKTSRPDDYRLAGVAEFWRVDARGDLIVFELFVLADGDYVMAEEKDGWQRSKVLGKWFKFDRDYDLVGDPKFHLRVKD